MLILHNKTCNGPHTKSINFDFFLSLGPINLDEWAHGFWHLAQLQIVVVITLGCIVSSGLIYWGQNKMDTIFHTTFSNAFSWLKMYEFQLRFHWSLFLRVQLTISPASVQIMAWSRPGDKPLSEPMMVSLQTHICVIWPPWVKSIKHGTNLQKYAIQCLHLCISKWNYVFICTMIYSKLSILWPYASHQISHIPVWKLSLWGLGTMQAKF